MTAEPVSRHTAGRHDSRRSGDVKRLARGGALNLGGAICSQVSILAITLIIARVLGNQDVGRYAQCYAFLALLGLLSLSGFRAGLTRFVTVHLSDRDLGGVRGTVRLGMFVTVTSSTLLAVALFTLAPALSAAFGDPELLTGLRYVAWALPAMTLTDAALAATQGWRTMRSYALIGQILEPTLRLLLTAGLLALGYGLEGAFRALTLSNWTAALVALVALHRHMRASRGTLPVYRPRQLFSFSSVSWMSSLASTGLIWASTVQLGLLEDSGEVGVYNAATRLVGLAVFVMPPLNAAFGPHIAHLYHRGRLLELRNAYGLTTSWIVRLSLPAFVLLFVFPSEMLGLFGDEFRTGAAVTVILAIGKMVDAVTGPCALMLNMSGRPAVNMIDNVGVLVLNVALNGWLIPELGIVGAALATTVSLCLVNVARLLQVQWLLKMQPFNLAVGKGLLAATFALGVAVAANRGLIFPWDLVIGVPAAFATYTVGLLLLGLSASDRALLGGATPRVLKTRRPATAGP